MNFLIDMFWFSKDINRINSNIILYTIVLTVLNDLFSYIIHLGMHKVAFLMGIS